MAATQVSRMLDEEHRRNLDLLTRVEHVIGESFELTPQLSLVLREFVAAMEEEIERHFAFEEEHLFPRIEDAGDGAIVAMMKEEHHAIRDVAAELLPLAREVAAGEVDEEAWDRLRVGTVELIERQVAHIQKETMAVLPLLEDLLDADTDAGLALGYAEA